VATVKTTSIEWGVASSALPGQDESGDRHLVLTHAGNTLIAVIDGIGHGDEAAAAAKAAVATLESAPEEHVISLIRRCHEDLRGTRGVVMSLASIDSAQGLMTWLGVGNVHGVLVRAGVQPPTMETLLLRAGVLGSQLPAIQAAVLPVGAGDVLAFATDGIRSEFAAGLSPLEAPQHSAERILRRHSRGSDDALVLVARIVGSAT
jgi:phosphoserine phosphatase RsbX